MDCWRLSLSSTFVIQCKAATLLTKRPSNLLIFYPDNDFQFFQSNSTDLHSWQPINTRLLDYLLNASSGRLPLEYISEKSPQDFNLLFVDTEPTIKSSSPKSHKSNKRTVNPQKPGRVNKVITKNTFSLQYVHLWAVPVWDIEMFLSRRPFTQRLKFWYFRRTIFPLGVLFINFKTTFTISNVILTVGDIRKAEKIYYWVLNYRLVTTMKSH